MATVRDGQPKLFVLDTNVILHDAGCIEKFEENDIAIPIEVLEELDKFQKGGGGIHYQAREFLRRIDELTGDVLTDEGVSLGDGRGLIRVVIGVDKHERVARSFFQDTMDHRILNTAYRLHVGNIHQHVILVTKDTNLRMKAKSLGVRAQDYIADKVQNFEALYSGKRTIDGVAGSVIDEFYADGRRGRVSVDSVPVPDPIANENFVLRNGSKSVLATYHARDTEFVRVHKRMAYGITPRNAEQSFAIEALTNDDIKLVTLVGRAGTGKTLLALAAALECRQRYRQILIARPVVPLSNRDLGFLPGDIDAKLDPYMQPLYDNLAVMQSELGEDSDAAKKIHQMRESEKILVTPLAYIRGRTLPRIFFIVDEAQNLTPHETKTIITRVGEGSKIVFTGDVHQIDQPYLDKLSNGLSYVMNRMVGQKLYAHVTLERGERSELAELASELL